VKFSPNIERPKKEQELKVLIDITKQKILKNKN
jgi:hypothetical protein